MRTVGLVFKEKRKLGKKEVMEILEERGIKYDKNAKLDELLLLLQEG